MAVDKDTVELISRSLELTEVAFDKLFPLVIEWIQKSATPEMTMAMVQALTRAATTVAISSVSTPLDTGVRDAKAMGEIAEAHWHSAVHITGLVRKEIERRGGVVDSLISRQLNALAPVKQENLDSAMALSGTSHPDKIAEGLVGELMNETEGKPAPDEVQSCADDVVTINSRGGSA